MVVLPRDGLEELEHEARDDGAYHGIMFGNSDLLEEIVETTEEQESDLCSGEPVDECSGLPITEFVEEVEQKPAIVGLVVNTQGSAATTGSVAAAASNSLSSSSSSSSSSSASAATTTTTTATSGRQHKSSRSSAGHHNHHSSNNSSSNSHAPSNGTSATGTAAARSTSSSSSGSSVRSHMEQEKRMRREIANSNERRRMQSINAGFQSLRVLLPHHEGEKLSKAAILQQTAEYIYQLEQQKTQLLSQNLQLKRLVDQHEGGEAPPKKRKKAHDSQGVVMSLPMHVSESGDEGLGSMSPEPLSVITVSADGHAVAPVCNEMAELKRQLENERANRAHLEKQLRSMQNQLFPDRFREEQLIAYQPHEVIEHTNNVLPQELEDGIPGLQVVSVVSVPTVGSTQTVETSNADSGTPPLSPQPGCEIIVPSNVEDDVVVAREVSVGELLQIESRPSSPKVVSIPFQSIPVFASQLEAEQQQQVNSSAAFSPVCATGVTYATTTSLPVAAVAAAAEFKTGQATQFITAGPARPFSPEQEPAASQQQTSSQQPPQQRLPSVLEAAMKAEPKVEVERLPSPSNSLDDGTPQARLYLANTSRQNLETIVEAIRHLEGDHLFSDEPAQDAPLALTNKPTASQSGAAQRILHADVSSFLQYHTQQPPAATTPAVASAASPAPTPAVTTTAPQQQPQSRTQQRPGVIVVKHS